MKLSEEEIEERVKWIEPEMVETMKSYLRREINLDTKTVDLVFDAGLLWGEAFRTRHPGSFWAIGAKPRSCMNFGYPVLHGIDQYRAEFNPILELHGNVALLLQGKSFGESLSYIMKIRAFELGFGPDPRK